MQITTEVLDHCYNHGFKGQDQMHLKSFLHLIRKIPLHFLLRMFIFGKLTAYDVQITMVTGNCYDLGIKGQGQIHAEYVSLLVTQIPLAILTQVLLILCNECQ